MGDSPAIAAVVTKALASLPQATRRPFLRDLMTTAADGLTELEGREACAEACAEAIYRLADDIATAHHQGEAE